MLNFLERNGLLTGREVGLTKNFLSGTADGLLRDKAILELKSINDAGFRSLTEPMPYHLDQVTVYMGLARYCGEPTKRSVVLYEGKSSQDLKEFEVGFDEGRFDALYNRAEKIQTHILNGTLHDREGLAPDVAPCKFCEYRKTCWEDQTGAWVWGSSSGSVQPPGGGGGSTKDSRKGTRTSAPSKEGPKKSARRRDSLGDRGTR